MVQTQIRRYAAQGRENTAPPVRRPGPETLPEVPLTGHRVDLPGEIREKMESSFGADFSNVKLYESEAVAEAGAQAAAQGSNIAFAPGKLDLASTAGQALLGHELSHVVSQARGESTGKGFLNDPRLEAQADRQGAMAARGESVYSGPVSPIGVSSASGASGPIQAKKYEEKAGIQMERQGLEGKAGDLKLGARRKLARAFDAEEKRREAINAPSSTRTSGVIPEGPVITENSPQDEVRLAETIARAKATGNIYEHKKMRMTNAGNNASVTDQQREFSKWYNEEFKGESNTTYKQTRDERMLRMGDGHTIQGLKLDRSYKAMYELGKDCGMEDDELKQMMRDLMASTRLDAADRSSDDPEEKAKAARESETTNAALRKVKGIYHHGLKKARDKYGVMMTQLHPDDAFNQAGDFWKDTKITQDCMQLLTDAPELFTAGNKEDEEFNNLTQYFMSTQVLLEDYSQMADEQNKVRGTGRNNFFSKYFRHFYGNAKQHEANVLAHDESNMPQMRDKEMRAYRRRAMKKKDASLGFDDFFKNEDERQDAAAFAAGDTMPRTESEGYESLEDLRRKKQGS